MQRIRNALEKRYKLEQEPSKVQTDMERRASFLRIINFGWLAMGAVALISVLFSPHEWPLLSTIIVVTVTTHFLIRYLSRHGRHNLAAMVFVIIVDLAFYLFFMITVAQLGADKAFEAQANIWMIMGLAIIFAGSLIGRWAPFGIAFMNSLTLVFTLLLLSPGSDPRPSIHVFWWLLALSVWLYENSLMSALNQLRRTLARQEDLIAARTEELQEAVDQLEVTRQVLQARNQELRSFTSSVSHDLRAPLRAIDGYSKIVLDDYSDQMPSDAVALLQKARQAAEHTNEMIDDLLSFARLGWRPVNIQPVNTNDLVKSLINELQSVEHSRQVDWIVSQLPECHADPTLLSQVWLNLLDNALKYTRTNEQAKIEIGFNQEGSQVVYYIRDNGIGFDMAHTDRLFGVFQRLHTDDEIEGSGIGLATVQRIIKLHDGRVWAESQPGLGATFFFTI